MKSVRERSGLYGAFTVRNPVGKAIGFLVGMGLLWGCWQWSRHIAGPVAWREKGLYVSTAWDAMVDPVLRTIPLMHLGESETYQVFVEQAPGWPLYTNEAKAAGKPYRLVRTAMGSGSLHKLLNLYVFAGHFWRPFAPVIYLWPLLFISCLVAGQIVDMKRLKKGRQQGVHIRGNRMVEQDEWNRRANEETA